MAIFVTSDWHFSHKNICGINGFETETRGIFETTEEMNNEIIKNIKLNTQDTDKIIHFGDIGFGNPKDLLELVNSIKREIIFIRGNHDNSKMSKILKEAGYEVHDVGMRHKENGKIYLFSHYPMDLGNQRVNIRNLCGHIHGLPANGLNTLNIGIDSPEIKSLGLAFGQPVPLSEAIRLVEDKWQRSMDGVN